MNVVIRNLPRRFDPAALFKVVSPCGQVLKCYLRSGRGFVHFGGEEAATRALGLTGTRVEGREIQVERELLSRHRRTETAATAAAAAVAASATEAAAASATVSGSAPAGSEVMAEAEAAPGLECAPRGPRRIHVDCLAKGTTADDLRAHFAGVGRVESANVIEGRNHGFVTFEDEAAGESLDEGRAFLYFPCFTSSWRTMVAPLSSCAIGILALRGPSGCLCVRGALQALCSGDVILRYCGWKHRVAASLSVYGSFGDNGRAALQVMRTDLCPLAFLERLKRAMRSF